MKKILFNLFVLLAFGTQLLATEPIMEKCCPVVVSTTAVDFSYDVDLYAVHFKPAYFNEATNALHFEAHSKIESIQVFDASGELKYKLPILSNKVRLSKNLFEKGDYKVEFSIEGQNDSLPAYVTIN